MSGSHLGDSPPLVRRLRVLRRREVGWLRVALHILRVHVNDTLHRCGIDGRRHTNDTIHAEIVAATTIAIVVAG